MCINIPGLITICRPDHIRNEVAGKETNTNVQSRRNILIESSMSNCSTSTMICSQPLWQSWKVKLKAVGDGAYSGVTIVTVYIKWKIGVKSYKIQEQEISSIQHVDNTQKCRAINMNIAEIPANIVVMLEILLQRLAPRSALCSRKCFKYIVHHCGTSLFQFFLDVATNAVVAVFLRYVAPPDYIASCVFYFRCECGWEE